jgi:ATP-binding cassette subfamily B protein
VAAQAWELVRPWRWALLGALVGVVAASGLDLVPPLIVGRLVDENLAQGRAEGLLPLALAYLSAIGAVHLLRGAITYLTAIAAQGAMRRLRVRLFAHLQRLPIVYHDETPIGDIISRCTSDMDTINNLFSLGIIHLLAQMVQLVAIVIAMVALSPLLSLVMLPLLPLVYWITRAFQWRMRDAEREVRRGVGVLNARLQETLSGAEVIHALHWQGRFLQRFRQTLSEALRATNRSVWYGAVYSPIMDILAAVIVVGLFRLGAEPRLGAALSLGALTSFVLLFLRFFEPIVALGEDWQTAQAALAGIERVMEVLKIPTEERPDPAGGDAGDMPPVWVRDLVFGYRQGEPVLNQVSLRVLPGQHVAIVGRTGAGKSSLFHLLGGLYHPWSGELLVAGRLPFALSDEERRRILGPVPQAVQLFSGTVRENLTLGDPTLTTEDLTRALTLSGAGEFVEALPQGIETVLSDQGGGGGVQLSGGQRQLLALARALAGDPQLLLLDEATASVDSATEESFRRALQAHMETRGGAVLTIAHRLATALEADEVVVLQDGCIAEQGPPEELLAAGGLLAGMWELERSGWA